MSSIQSVIFDIKIFTPLGARNWLKKHKLKSIKSVDKTLNYLRYRIRPPAEYKQFRIKNIGNGVKFVLGFK